MVDRAGAIKGGMLTSTVNAGRRGGIASSYYRLLKTSFGTALVSTSLSRKVVEETADRASLCVLFA